MEKLIQLIFLCNYVINLKKKWKKLVQNVEIWYNLNCKKEYSIEFQKGGKLVENIVGEKDKKTILVVDDEENIRELLVFNLQKEGYNTLEAQDGITAVDMALEKKPDLILLDVMIPKLDGISVCKKIRYALNISNIPILMISAKDSESDKIVGLEMGADDYITKPFQIREVMARIKANLRKAELNSNYESSQVAKANDKSNIIKVGDLTLDTKKVEVRVKGEVINLTKKEFDVLKYLASQPGQVVTREMLLREVWEYEEYVGAIRTIDVTMNRIRDKIEKDKANPKILITKRGVGYYVTDKN
mgnify:FL=1